MSFGEEYTYSKSKSSPPAAFPEPITNLISAVTAKFPEEPVSTSALINKYTGKDCYLPEHSDDESTIDPGSSVYTISLGGQGVVKFRNLYTGEERESIINPSSLYSMTRQSQAFWSHRIDKQTDDDFERYSITLRVVHGRFIKSTVVIGDSNTNYLKFGKGTGTFGFFMPGRQIYTPKVEQINPLDCAGYSNIFIHCGINNLKNHQVSPSECFSTLKEKIEVIQTICPQSKVFISPILPTKSVLLNKRAVLFNKYLFEYVNLAPSSKKLYHLHFDSFCNEQGFLQESYGRYLNHNDSIHLGKVGYRFLANIIKDCVTNNKVDGRDYSDVTSLHRHSVNSDMRSGKRRAESEKNGVYRGSSMNRESMNRLRGVDRVQPVRSSMNMMNTTTTSNCTLLAASQQSQT